MEPPTKKPRPYVTKFQRRQAEQNQNNVVTPTAVVHKTLTFNNTEKEDDRQSDLKALFITNETVLDYHDRNYKSVLPR